MCVCVCVCVAAGPLIDAEVQCCSCFFLIRRLPPPCLGHSRCPLRHSQLCVCVCVSVHAPRRMPDYFSLPSHDPPHTHTHTHSSTNTGAATAMLRRSTPSTLLVTRALSSARGQYFGPVEVKDGVAIIRIDGPGKMNTIDDNFRQEIDTLWTVSL